MRFHNPFRLSNHYAKLTDMSFAVMLRVVTSHLDELAQRILWNREWAIRDWVESSRPFDGK